MSLPQDNIYYAGDTIELEFQLWIDKNNNIPWDLTDNQIRFQLDTNPVIKKATPNVPGGSSDQINVTNPTLGIFVVIIPHDESENIIIGDYEFAIKVTTPDSEPLTVLVSKLRILENEITWDSE